MKKNYMVILCFTLFVILTLCWSYPLQAQGEKIRFKHLSIEDGLSQSSVYCTIQDNKGFLWFGTEAGLNRYDGYNFVTHLFNADNPNSLSHGWIFSVFLDRQGIFWIGTEDGLNRFDRGKEQFLSYRHDPKDPNSISNNRILAIIEDSSGNLWIGTDNGLNKLNRSNGQFTRYQTDPQDPQSLSHNSIRFIHEDRSGLLWIGTNGGGLNKFDAKQEKFTHIRMIPGNPNSLSDDKILCLCEDQKGIFWIGTELGGLVRFDRSKKQFAVFKNKPNDVNSLSGNHIKVVFEDSQGVLWIGTNESGLNVLDRKSMKFFHYKNNPDDPYSMGSNRVLSIYEDNAGGLWFGNYAGGINIFDRETRKFIHYQTEPNNPNSLSYNDIRQVFEDHRGLLWIGTDGGGLNRFDRKRQQFTHFKRDAKKRGSISDNRIFAICEDHDKVLWIGTNGGGLNKFNRQKQVFKSYRADPQKPDSLKDDRIRSLCVDHAGKLWLGTDGGGLNKFDTKMEKFSHYLNEPGNPYSLSKNRIFCMMEDHQNILWIGTFGGGLEKFDPKTEKFYHFRNDPNDPQSLSNNYVLSIHEDQRHAIWVGADGGLNKFDREKKNFTRYTVADGLANNVIYDILSDNSGCVWMATNKGLSKYDPKTETFKNYDMKDGLQSNEFNTGTGYKSKRGEMFFGGVNGFNSFFPEKIIDNPHIPQIVITDFQLFNKPVPIGKRDDGRLILRQCITETKEIELLYKDKVFSFEFAALHFASPDKNMYAYMMEGFEDNWNYVNNRHFATYTGLPPGDYIFKVKGSNNDGIWNEKYTSLRVKINPPFWKKTWFVSMCGLLILLSVIGIYRLRVRQLQTRKVELEKLVKERTGQLADSNKKLGEANKELEKLSVVVRETDHAVLITDAEGHFIWLNEGFTQMYGLSLDQLIRERGANIKDVSTYPQIEEKIESCVKENTTSSYESSFQTDDGKTIWTQTSLTPIFDENNRLTNLVAIDSDISKIKEAEMTAERANQSKSEFLARMSHEIRTPMNGVIGFSDMLLDTDLNAEQIDYARTISRSGEALITLLNDILDFSKIEAGELTIHPIDFDPEITVFDVCDIISPRIGTKNVELICRMGDTVPAYIKGDAGRFRQVIINMMGNAAKFTEEGEIELSLVVAEEKEEQVKLHVKVRDTGIGIAAEKVESVFDVFQQADGSTTRRYGGTGLGLTICKQISNLMDGDVWVESEEDVGSTFHFTSWMDRSQKEIELQPAYDFLEGRRVLIVDDNITNLEILSHTLKRSGMDVIQLTNPLDVIPELKKNFKESKSVDICIIDIQMPKSSGYDVAREIRQLQAPLSEIPLLAYSSSTLSRSRKYKESGFDGYLPKPVHRKKLLKMIGRLLGKVEEVEDETKEEIVTQHSIVEETKHSVRILLAEDNAINMKLALFMLQKAGYQVTVAKNGEEAVEIFSKKPDRFDLIFMDIQMPKLDGREAARILREKGFKDIPIVAMTAESMKGDREKCIEAGMDDYISKPIRREVVFKVVKKWCIDK